MLNELLTHELIHLFLAIATGVVIFQKTKEWKALFWTVVASMFLDIDHFIDYFYAYGLNINLTNIISGDYFDITNRVFVPLHSWEIAIVLFILSKRKSFVRYKTILLSLSLGVFGHLLVDQIDHNQPLGFYFLIVRVYHGFFDPEYW
ncbi:hypothetical protein HYW42_01715 [Candidatus Daviesbacteria bacterium]|nr:hypothetical protein [Candidatus Daviesbacteria bacterium]